MNDRCCPVCAGALSPGLRTWLHLCINCGYECSVLDGRINESSAHHLIDEARREQGLKALRQRNFGRLLQELCRWAPPGNTLLEVGSAHGWFLSLAKSIYRVTGVEPDDAVRRTAQGVGADLRAGYFPQVLGGDEKFDVIVFNDVFEHIPDSKTLLREIRHHLAPQGVLLLNLPSSKGVFYRVARSLARLGMPGNLDRMWQKGMPSPHLHYFHPQNIDALLANNGFRVIKRGTLASLHHNGLWDRIAYDQQTSKLTQGLIWTMVTLALPVIRLLPSDIMFLVAIAHHEADGPVDAVIASSGRHG